MSKARTFLYWGMRFTGALFYGFFLWLIVKEIGEPRLAACFVFALHIVIIAHQDQQITKLKRRVEIVEYNLFESDAHDHQLEAYEDGRLSMSNSKPNGVKRHGK